MTIRHEDNGYHVVLRETISVHHETVFGALTTAVGLTRWLSVTAQIDELDAGGIVRLGWDEKGKKTTTIAILEYDAGGRVKWDWCPRMTETHAPVTWTVTPDMEKGSVVECRQGPFGDDVESLVVMADESQYWRWYLCNLRTTHEANHDMRAIRPL